MSKKSAQQKSTKIGTINTSYNNLYPKVFLTEQKYFTKSYESVHPCVILFNYSAFGFSQSRADQAPTDRFSPF